MSEPRAPAVSPLETLRRKTFVIPMHGHSTCAADPEVVKWEDVVAALSTPAPRPETDVLTAARNLLAQFEALKRRQHRLLVEGQTLESAAANWDEATRGDFLDFEPLQRAVEAAGAAPRRADAPPPKNAEAKPLWLEGGSLIDAHARDLQAAIRHLFARFEREGTSAQKRQALHDLLVRELTEAQLNALVAGGALGFGAWHLCLTDAEIAAKRYATNEEARASAQRMMQKHAKSLQRLADR